MKYVKLVAILSLLYLVVACTQSNPTQPGTPGTPNPPGNAGGVESYVMKGYATNSQGAPLEGVEVFADNTLLYDSNIVGTTDASGLYRLELPALATTWAPGAYIRPTFEGQSYEFRLVPDNASEFAGVDGAVRNFTWQLSGATPEGDGYYGALIYVYADTAPEGSDINDVEFTLVPEGPLIDGSAGQTIVKNPEFGEIVDVPIGRYTITGQYVDVSGIPRTVLLANRNGDGSFQPSQSATFVNDSYYGPNIELFVQIQ